MTPIKFPHKQFLQDNSQIIAKRPLPEFLLKRIQGFEELEEDLPFTTDEDRERLEAKLERLSHELDQDLEEHFEYELENNDLGGDDLPDKTSDPASLKTHSPDATQIIQEGKQRPSVSRGQSEQGFDRPQGNQQNRPAPEKAVYAEELKQTPRPTSDLNDEKIITELVKEGQTQVTPQKLKALGFNGTVSHRRLKIGRYTLIRRRYDTAYWIIA